MCAGEHHNPRGFALEPLYPAQNRLAFFVFAHIEAKTGKPHPVKEPLKERRHGAPPVGVDDKQVVAPFYSLLQCLKVRLQFLNHFVALVENGVKAHVADIETPYFVSRPHGLCLVQNGKVSRQGFFVRVTKQNNYFLLFGRAKKHG